MMNCADEIKRAVTMRDICNVYGIAVNVQNKAICPFHDDRHASMHVYSGERGYWCFTCGEGGSVIDFVMKYFGLAFYPACQKINNDFGLGLPFGQAIEVNRYKELQQQAETRKRELRQKQERRDSLSEAYNVLLDVWVIMDRVRRENAPKSFQDGLRDSYAFAVAHIDYIGHLLDGVCCEMHRLEM